MEPETVSTSESRVRIGNALGVFFVALSTLMLEIVLTRIFSVTIWYHFGALAISLAMFGIGASGVLVYIVPSVFGRERLQRQLPVLCAVFAASIAVCFFLQLGIAFIPRFSLAAIGTLTLFYIVTAVPFFFSGLCISLIFTHLPLQIGRLYFMDLLGAGLGCIIAVGAMFLFSAPNVVLLAALLASIGSICFASAAQQKRWGGVTIVALGLAALLGVNLRTNVFRLDFVKGKLYPVKDFEKWNPYAYVSVGKVLTGEEPFGWGLSRKWKGTPPAERVLTIDAGAATTITKFDGDYKDVDYLRFDVTSIGHYLLKNHKTFIIGAGGGRDVLAALAFGAHSVHALEYNASVVDAANDYFGDFSGHVYELPNVKKIVDEGRSYAQRSDEKFDFIQASLVDSWAANASGAYVMAENFLYTKQAFSTFFEHLTDRGLLSISRFNFAQTPQLLRAVSVALAVLKEHGVEQAADHLMVVTARHGNVGTMLLARTPFSEAQVRTMQRETQRLGFALEWAPGRKSKSEIAKLLTADDPERFISEYPFDLSPPTDDKPFFFHMANSRRAWKHLAQIAERRGGVSGFNLKWYGTFVLLGVLLVASVLAVVCILLPLYTFKRADLRGVKGKSALLGYFTCLGLGFMLVEIPLMQRFTLFLGHPVYALSIVLFAVLMFAGFGSLISSQMQSAPAEVYLRRVLLVLVVVIGLYNYLVPGFMNQFIVYSAPVRMGLAVLVLLPLGLLLGMPLPLGMRVVERRAVRLIPWMWGVNGACSVFASLFALALAMTFGFTRTMLGGHAIYLIALLLALTFRTPGQPAAAGVEST